MALKITALKITKDSCFIRAIDTDGEVLPIVYNGHFIGRNFYENHPNLKELEIGEGIVEISEGAFEGCTSLTSVKLPASLKIIRQDTFADCTSLQKVILDESVTKINCRIGRGGTLILRPSHKEMLVKHLVTEQGEIEILHKGEYDPHYWD